MTDSLEAALARARDTLSRFDLWPKESIIIGNFVGHPADTAPLTLADLRLLLTAVATGRADTARLDALEKLVREDDAGVGCGAVTVVWMAEALQRDGILIPATWSLTCDKPTVSADSLRAAIDAAAPAAPEGTDGR